MFKKIFLCLVSFDTKRSNLTRGFSLVELLVTISIIGILATVVGVNYSTVKKATRDAKREADLENIAASFEMYYSEFKKYPTCGWNVASVELNKKGYLISVPEDPVNSQEEGLQYKCLSGDSWFGIFAKLEKPNDPTLTLTLDPAQDNISSGNGTYEIGDDIYYRVVGGSYVSGN